MKIVMRGRRAIALLCMLVLVIGVAGVGGYTWWRHRAPENEPISESLCDGMLQTHAISQAIGVQAVDGFVDERGDVFYFDCEIRFEELGGIRVSYLSVPYFFWTLASYEDDIKALDTRPGFSVTQLDTGLDGHTYLIVPGDDWRRATCVWYSDTGRTLTITIAIEQDQIPDDELPQRAEDLMIYIGSTLQTVYPSPPTTPHRHGPHRMSQTKKNKNEPPARSLDSQTSGRLARSVLPGPRCRWGLLWISRAAPPLAGHETHTGDGRVHLRRRAINTTTQRNT